ncbi:endothelin-converting enzyme homolog isoform X1 [Mytilus edulis]|uniref:endothelin-converting enzyme homolog isoform X1 n=2 Tax=Mytilus edulis TaxID=6550 RepID=UPI0039EFBBDE
MIGIRMDNYKMSSQGYKRTNFEEDDISNGGSPPAIDFNASVVFKGGLTLWQRKTVLERFLFVFNVLLCITVIILAILVATKHKQIIKMKEQAVCLTPACVTVASSMINAMDLKADPCNDFYQYACGGWIDAHPIPSGHSRWGTFSVLWQENQVVMKKAIDKDLPKGSSLSERKSQLYFASCMDKNKTIEELGAKPLLDLLKLNFSDWSISNQSTSKFDLQTYIENLKMLGINAFFSVWVGEDDRNSSANILQIDQSGLGLPERDYYLNKSITEDKVLKAYLKYLTKVGVLLGEEENSTRQQMIDVIEFETQIANITIPREERRDEEKIYHKITIGKLQENSTFVNWNKFFNKLFSAVNIKLTPAEPIVAYSPKFLKEISDLVEDTMKTEKGRRTVQNYLVVHVIKTMANYLSRPFRDARKILTEALSGVTGGDELWRYCISDTDSVLGFALGAMFVKEAFNGRSKDKAEAMIAEVKTAFINNLPNLKWMDEFTRKAAIDKANAVIDMIGFPAFINNKTRLDKEYSGLIINGDEYFWNNVRNLYFIQKKDLAKLRKSPESNAWGMSPPTVNAYYTPSKNQIVFPAGILQAPFYDQEYPKSLNFGAMGVVMGHELTHGFDDQGREYDKFGNLRPWWNNRSIENFNIQTKCFINQYSSYKLQDDHVDGKQTLGENIADNGGLKSAYHAYLDWVGHHTPERPLPTLNLTHQQLFFLGFAQVWCSSSTAEADHLQILTDPHSPAKYRVIGTLSNSKEFAENYGCAKNSRMNPVHKCEVW